MQLITIKPGISLITDFLPAATDSITEDIMKEAGIGRASRGRQMARMTDPGMPYTIFGKPYRRLDYSPTVQNVRAAVESSLGVPDGYFNTCTFNYYPTGSAAWRSHTDKMPDLEQPMIVATLTLGHSNREMLLTHMFTKEKIRVQLPHNSLLVMGAGIQDTWLHGVPNVKGAAIPRLSMSFRRQKPRGVALLS